MVRDARTLDRLASIATDAFAKKIAASGGDSEQMLRDKPEIRQTIADKVNEVLERFDSIAQAARGQGLHQLAAALPALAGVTLPNAERMNPLEVMEAVLDQLLVQAGNSFADDFTIRE